MADDVCFPGRFRPGQCACRLTPLLWLCGSVLLLGPENQVVSGLCGHSERFSLFIFSVLPHVPLEVTRRNVDRSFAFPSICVDRNMAAFTEAARQPIIELWVRNLEKSKNQVLKTWKGLNVLVHLNTGKQSCGLCSCTHTGWFWRGQSYRERTQRAGGSCSLTADVPSYSVFQLLGICAPSSSAPCSS